ncbi:DUF3313 domain-containing protein [Sodalis sp. RH21]|uniref:DUF3313 domain-containing protein n=1 Tax=unclassified Sodalis (in: enterobacteria) TaxID=2636512 RepID=UPI0039B4C50B
MVNFNSFRLFPLVFCAVLAGCAGTQPVNYSGITSSPQLRPNADDRTGRVPYSYSAGADWKKYASVIVEPVAIYQGADNQFDDISNADRSTLANYMENHVKQSLGQRFRIVETPAADTLRIKLTLTGAETTTPVLGTFSRFDLMGGPYNIVQSIRGKQGALTGSVSYAVEIYEAATNRLLSAYVTKQYPNALNIGASWGSLAAAEAGIDKGAEELVARLR